jgi:pimeloyl-ACP methyl ester carboxylesterase
LVDHLKLDRFHLVGTAAGGIVSLDFAVSFSQRLRSLVVANSVGGVQDEDYLELGRRLRPAAVQRAASRRARIRGRRIAPRIPHGTARWLELEKISRPEGTQALARHFATG